MLRSLRTPALARRTALRQLATVVCAPSNNLNSGFTHYPTAKELYAHIRQLSQNDSKEFVVRNFVGVIEDVSVAASTVETELFPKSQNGPMVHRNISIILVCRIQKRKGLSSRNCRIAQ